MRTSGEFVVAIACPPSQLLSALASRIGSISRFPRPRSLANYFGLTPGCRNSGNTQDRPAGLVKNSGGTKSETNLAIINAFRQSRSLAPITMEQLTRTSGDRVIDLRATKAFSLSTHKRLDVFVEAYNLLNAVNYENPSGTISSASFTVYTTARDARQVQWGARFQF